MAIDLASPLFAQFNSVEEVPMAELPDEFEWSDPILPVVAAPEWATQVKARLGSVPDFYMRVSPSLWLREALLKWDRVPLTEIPVRLADIAVRPAAATMRQENDDYKNY